MDYQSHGRKLAKDYPGARTISADIEGRLIWFKQPVPPKARIWHTLQKFLAMITRLPILRATVSPGGTTALRAEAQRLQQFKSLGFHVPDVLALHDDMIVMTHAGPSLRDQLDRLNNRDAQIPLLKKALEELNRLHQAGLAHGRPYMRDMTWDENKIGFLDLEEDPMKVMPLATAQARDVWIFLSAASRYARRPGEKKIYEGTLIADLFNQYAQNASAETIEELRSFVSFLKPLRKLLDNKLLWDHIGTDARQSVYVNRCLENSLK